MGLTSLFWHVSWHILSVLVFVCVNKSVMRWSVELALYNHVKLFAYN